MIYPTLTIDSNNTAVSLNDSYFDKPFFTMRGKTEQEAYGIFGVMLQAFISQLEEGYDIGYGEALEDLNDLQDLDGFEDTEIQ